MTLWQWMNTYPYLYCICFFGFFFLIACIVLYIVFWIISPKETLYGTKQVLKKTVFVIALIIYFLAEIIIMSFEKIAIAMGKIADFMDGGEYDE